MIAVQITSGTVVWVPASIYNKYYISLVFHLHYTKHFICTFIVIIVYSCATTEIIIMQTKIIVMQQLSTNLVIPHNVHSTEQLII